MYIPIVWGPHSFIHAYTWTKYIQSDYDDTRRGRLDEVTEILPFDDFGSPYTPTFSLTLVRPTILTNDSTIPIITVFTQSLDCKQPLYVGERKQQLRTLKLHVPEFRCRMILCLLIEFSWMTWLEWCIVRWDCSLIVLYFWIAWHYPWSSNW